jgi:CubicO group peptidase (beta-lactamase class C family)
MCLIAVLLVPFCGAARAEFPSREIDMAVTEAIGRGELPGAVVLVLHRDEVVFRRAYGHRSLKPTQSPMTPDVIFDLASLTKPLAAATSVMLLIEQGKLKLSDRVADHLPAFASNGKDAITVEQLLTHVSGLIADNPVGDYRDGREKALERVFALKPIAEPGSRFIYSDVNFIVLGELVSNSRVGRSTSSLARTSSSRSA